MSRTNKQRTENRTKKDDRGRENKQRRPSAVHVFLPLTARWRTVSRLRDTAAAALPASPLLPPTHLLSHRTENREQDKEGRQREREQAAAAVCCACVPASDCALAHSQPAQRHSSGRPACLPPPASDPPPLSQNREQRTGQRRTTERERTSSGGRLLCMCSCL